MAKTKPDPKRSRGNSYRGRFYDYQVGDQTVAAAWPPKRPRFLTEDQRITQNLFIEACRAMKMMDAGIQNYARENAKGTPMLPRDSLLAALYGRGPKVVFNNGLVLRPMPTRINMSELLDNIAWKPGSMLFRGQDTWVQVEPGQYGQVLKYQSKREAPQWTDQTELPNLGEVCLMRTTPEANSGTWPRKIQWQKAAWDTAGLWNPKTPTRIAVPAKATRIRQTLFVMLESTTNLQSFYAGIALDGNISGTDELPNMTRDGAANAYSGNRLLISHHWLPVPKAAFIEARLNSFAAASTGVSVSTKWTIEFA